jgi:hypothetical protein
MTSKETNNSNRKFIHLEKPHIINCQCEKCLAQVEAEYKHQWVKEHEKELAEAEALAEQEADAEHEPEEYNNEEY